MVYSKLMLSAGGGIISTIQQAAQEQNTASVLIGLGGTGIDCLKTIKAAVYERLIPDDPASIVAEYSHIQFLGVDTDTKSFKYRKNQDLQKPLMEQELKMLDETEIFDISNPNIGEALKNERAIDMRNELGWLQYRELNVPNLTDSGAGCIRQIGRYMLMDRSSDFIDKATELIQNSKRGLMNPYVNIHIFAGISGGTGSGTFLDVCYMVKEAAAYCGGATVYGYFFLPDVNLSQIPMENRLVRSCVPCNGYAAMQELDYCMRIDKNGGSFTQDYKNGKQIKWEEPPVNMCHLICATDTNNNVIPNAYNYAMNVTTEYVMDFLTESSDPNNFGLRSHLTNFTAQVEAGNQKKIIGSHLAYCILGAACASIPLREINTYLASFLFKKFETVKESIPTENDVEKFAEAAGIHDYDTLLRELEEGAKEGYEYFGDTWKDAKKYGDNDLVLHYINQTASQKGKIEANAQSMSSEKNTQSLIARIRSKLDSYSKNLDYGPVYAYRLLEAAQKNNLLNIIDGLIQTNKERKEQEQTQQCYEDYLDAQNDFKEKPNKKRYEEYEWRIECLEKQRRSIYLYEQMDKVLVKLRKQIEECTAGYYIILNRVVHNLISTFAENRTDLQNTGQVVKSDGFEKPLMSIHELKEKLDETIEKVDAAGLMNQFMGIMLSNDNQWIQEDENKITKLVTEFFVKTAFHDFANRTITAFLADKYDTTNNQVITNRLYNEYISVLSEKAKPLFAFNTSVWDSSRCGNLAFISVPAAAAPVVDASYMLQSKNQLYRVKQSALTDRIYLMYSACALPLGSYAKCVQYEKDYFSGTQTGRHYYEGKPSSMRFNDWRKLTSLTPESHIDYSIIPRPLQMQLEETDRLYQQAIDCGLITNSQVMRFTQPCLQAIKEGLEQAENAQVKAQNEVQKGKLVLTNAMNDLQTVMEMLKMEATEYVLPAGSKGTLEDIERVQKDYFFASPALHVILEESLFYMEKIKTKQKELLDQIEEMIQEDQSIEEFCHALFAGIFKFEMVKVTYVKEDMGIETIVEMSKMGEGFPYCTIPLYQALITYQHMDQEDKKKIKTIAESRFNDYSAEMLETLKVLTDRLTPAYNNMMAQNAAKFPAEYDAIITFIKKLTVELTTIKGMMGF